jgi:hypothetical protein
MRSQPSILGNRASESGERLVGPLRRDRCRTAGGAIVLLWPDLSATALLYAIAVWAIIVRVIDVVAALVLPLSGTGPYSSQWAEP